MTAIYLTLAIASEVIATLALKSSEGFSRPLPAAIVVVGYGISFFLLAIVLKHLSVGTTYAIWSAVGTAAIALIGIAAYGETANVLKIASLGLIVLGVVGLNAAGAH
jgi:multidrug transporter EmrE-like cation transporter